MKYVYYLLALLACGTTCAAAPAQRDSLTGTANSRAVATQYDVKLEEFAQDPRWVGWLIDLVILLLLSLGAYSGYRRGLFSYLLLFSSSGLFFYALEVVFNPLKSWISSLSPVLALFASTIALLSILALFFIGLKLISKLVHHIFDHTMLGYIDRLLGIVTGLLISAFLLSGCTILMERYNVFGSAPYSRHSYLYGEIQNVAPALMALMKVYFPKLKAFVAYWQARLRQ